MKKNKRLQNLVNQAVEASFVKGRLNQAQLKSFVTLFKKLSSTDGIFALNQFKKGIKRELDKVILEVESDSKLTAEDLKRLKKILNFQFLNFKLNPQVLAGVKLTIGDTVYEDTISSRIEQLQEVIHG